MINPENICRSAIPIIKEAGEYIRNMRQHIPSLQINKKGVRDFVTEVDMNSEIMLVAKLKEILPEAGFITEEKTVSQDQHEYNWIIDPLDGTMNYLHGIPLYSVSVALEFNREIIAGMVYEIVHGEMFYSWKGGNSFCNEKIIHVNKTIDLKDALIVTGFPYIRNDKRTSALSETIKYFLDNGRDIRRLGTAATDLCYIACGRIDIYYEGFLNSWDIAAGILIARNAGALATNFAGDDNFEKGQVLVANPELHGKALEGVKNLIHL